MSPDLLLLSFLLPWEGDGQGWRPDASKSMGGPYKNFEVQQSSGAAAAPRHARSLQIFFVEGKTPPVTGRFSAFTNQRKVARPSHQRRQSCPDHRQSHHISN